MKYSHALFAFTFIFAACGDATTPSDELPGTWDLIGFTDDGMAAQTTGTVEFGTDGTFEVDGTITFPGEATVQLVLTGSWSAGTGTVALTTADGTNVWTIPSIARASQRDQARYPPAGW